jgi:small conductance mechanosensitive channel
MISFIQDTDPTITETAGEKLSEVQKLVEHYGDALKTWAIDNVPSIVLALILLVVGRWVAKIITRTARKLLARQKVDPTLVGFIGNLLYMALFTIVLVAAAEQAGIETSGFLAIFGAAVFAIGFALQGSLSNFAAGIMLIFFRPIRVGDFVEAGGTSGVVMEIGIFATVMKTGDNKKIIVPNSGITGGNITNYSANPTRRVDMVFGIGYGDDIAAARKAIEDVLARDERVLKDPAPTIGVSELADSSVNFVVRPWVNTADYWNVRFDTHENIKLEFDKRGITIPFPQRDVHMHQAG